MGCSFFCDRQPFFYPSASPFPHSHKLLGWCVYAVINFQTGPRSATFLSHHLAPNRGKSETSKSAFTTLWHLLTSSRKRKQEEHRVLKVMRFASSLGLLVKETSVVLFPSLTQCSYDPHSQLRALILLYPTPATAHYKKQWKLLWNGGKH